MWRLALGFLLTTAWWFYAFWNQYGSPIFYPLPNTITMAEVINSGAVLILKPF